MCASSIQLCAVKQKSRKREWGLIDSINAILQFMNDKYIVAENNGIGREQFPFQICSTSPQVIASGLKRFLPFQACVLHHALRVFQEVTCSCTGVRSSKRSPFQQEQCCSLVALNQKCVGAPSLRIWNS